MTIGVLRRVETKPEITYTKSSGIWSRFSKSGFDEYLFVCTIKQSQVGTRTLVKQETYAGKTIMDMITSQ